MFAAEQERPDVALATIGATPDEVSRVGAVDYAIVMTHSLEHDRAWLEYLLSTGTQYVGMLGPKERTDRMMQALDVSGDRRVFGPVGLSLGSEGPEQVALSVVAEVLAVHHGGTPEHLRDLPGPIHA